jgi:hypothetical protein
MTLKEKFEEILIAFWTSEWESECEKTADEFAIGFADWVRVCKLKQRPYDFDNIKELLEIYKDEKGL